MLHSVLVILTVLCALQMIFMILLQDGRDGELSSFDGTKAQFVQGVTNPIRRATVWTMPCG